MAFTKLVKRFWGWWMRREKSTRLMVYLLLAWEIIGVTLYLLLSE